MIPALAELLRVEQDEWATPPQPPATEAALADLVTRARRELGRTVPAAYLDLLRVHDGVDANGLTLYGTRTAPAAGSPTATILGVVEANRSWEGYAGLLLVGDSHLDLLGHDPAAGDWFAADKPSGSVHTRHRTLADLVTEAVQAVG